MIRDTTNQFGSTGSTGGTGTAITFNTNDYISNITHVLGTSQITINVNGTYLFIYSIELHGNSADVDIWVSKNGVGVTGTTRRITLQNVNDYKVVTFSFVTNAVINDYYELFQTSTNTTAGLTSVTGITGPTRPDISSAVVTVSKVSN
jgi:hypothetical protein